MRLNPHSQSQAIEDGSVHIASFVVQADAARLPEICTLVVAIDGVKIHATDPCGKLVVTAESDSEGSVLGALDRIRECRGVFSANLVYHQIENQDTLDQEICV